jgi:ABC-type glycerol-3-phosphate transport system substrate-binding protein
MHPGMKRTIAIVAVAAALAVTGCGGGGGGESPAAEDTVTTTTAYTGPGSGMLSQVDKAQDVADSLEQRNSGLEDLQP